MNLNSQWKRSGGNRCVELFLNILKKYKNFCSFQRLSIHTYTHTHTTTATTACHFKVFHGFNPTQSSDGFTIQYLSALKAKKNMKADCSA